MAETMLEDGPTTFCENCKTDIAQKNYELHHIHCYRNVMLCTKCQAPVRKLDMEEHMEENHALVECQCKVKVENAQLEKHKKEECSHRMTQCLYCEMSLKHKDHDEHAKACGSRTEPCEKCGNYIMIRDAPTHDCSLVKPKQKETYKPIDDFPYHFLDNSPRFCASSNSNGIGNSALFRNGIISQSHFNGTGNIPLENNEDDVVPIQSGAPSSSAGISRELVGRPKATRRRIVKKTEMIAQGDDDKVDVNLEDLNLNNARTNRNSIAKKQVGNERIASRSNRFNNTRPTGGVKAKKIEKTDNLSFGIQGRSVLPDVLARGSIFPSGSLDQDVCADSVRRGKGRNGGEKSRRARNLADKIGRDADTGVTGSAAMRDIPIRIEDEPNELIAENIDADVQPIRESTNPDNEAKNFEDDNFQIPCEICETLINMSELGVHQERCLLEQQQALQTFNNQIVEPEPPRVERIVVDDKPEIDDNASIPCEFCEEAFPIDSVIVHQPYCDKNPQRHNAIDHMDIANTNTSLPASNRPQGYWESRLNARSDFEDESIYRPPFDVAGTNSSFTDSGRNRGNYDDALFEVDNDVLMANDFDDVEDNYPTSRPQQRH